MTVGLVGVRPGATGHQFVFYSTVLHQRDFLRANPFFVNGVFAQQGHALEFPGAKEFKGVALLGKYAVDEEGVRAQKVTLVENGTVKNELMSRRPGPDSDQSNGHGRAAFLNDAKPTMSNMFFSSTETLTPADLKKKFLDACRAEKLNYCIIVREMDNPTLSLLHQEDFSELLASFGGGAGTGDRLP